MRTFVLHLHGATQYERFDDVVTFTAADTSGSFGILAGHERLLACLTLGLAWFRTTDHVSQYLAMPGGVAYFVNDELQISTRRYLRHHDRQHVSMALHEQFVAEEEGLREIRDGVARLEREMLRRLWTTTRRAGPMR